MERHYIKKYDSYKNGYNSTPGGKSFKERKTHSKINKIAQFSSNGELIAT